MRRLTWLLAVGLFLARGSGIAAQEAGADTLRVPSVNAGGVATLILQLPAPEGADSASYVVELADEFRPFMATEGRLSRLDDLFILPVSFATPERLPAGRILAGRVTLDVDGYEPTFRELAVRIRERRDTEFVLETDEVTVTPDGVAGIPFRVHNRGNLADTVDLEVRAGDGWSLISTPRLVVQPGDSVISALRIASPVTATPGDRELVLVTGRTVGGEQTRTLSMVVVSPSGWFGDLAQVPSSVFVGQSLGTGSEPVVALNGGGKIGPDTDLRIDLRHSGQGLVDPALQRQLTGARFRVALSRPGLELDAGDVYSYETTLTGSLRQAVGVRSEYDPGSRFSFRGIVAAPTGFGGEVDGGHIVHGEAGITTRYGDFELLAGDMDQPSRGGLVGTRSTGAGLRWSGATGPHRIRAEATALRFAAADSLERTGPAFDLDYALSLDGVNGRLRVRHVPDAATGPGGRGNELSGSFSAAIAPRVYLTGWGYTTEQNLLGNASRSEATAANLGVRATLGRFQVHAGGNLSDRTTLNDLGEVAFARTTFRTEATYTHGPLSLQSDVEIGRSRELGIDGDYRAVGGSLRWYGARQWGWLRIHHAVRPGGVESTNLHTGGTITFGPVELAGGLSTALSGGIGSSTSFWSATEIQALRNLSIHVGASARPTFDASNWTFSLGVSRRLNLPLPIARQPDLHGVVFDDANNNGALDPGEAPVSGVELTLGYLDAETDDVGRFQFRDATGAPVRVAPSSLPIGYVLSPLAVLPARGRASIPLLQTATLHLDLFLDRDEDGQRDAAESAGAGVVVVLTDERGRERTVTADSTGSVRVSGLLPGRYAITARPGTARGDADAEVLMEVELHAGAEARHTLAVPLRRRTIRMGGDSGGAFQFFEND